jgi:hypothetical protein
VRRFVAKREPGGALRAVECFNEHQIIDAEVAVELAEIEGLEARVFIGADLADVARSSPAWFAEPTREMAA